MVSSDQPPNVCSIWYEELRVYAIYEGLKSVKIVLVSSAPKIRKCNLGQQIINPAIGRYCRLLFTRSVERPRLKNPHPSYKLRSVDFLTPYLLGHESTSFLRYFWNILAGIWLWIWLFLPRTFDLSIKPTQSSPIILLMYLRIYEAQS